MKIIFLDVDGVLNNLNWAIKMGDEHDIDIFAQKMLYPKSIELLKKIINTTNAKIVISSSWRKIPSCMKALTQQLNENGIEILDVTPYVGSIRGDDISEWLKNHSNIKNYVILDDDSDMGQHTPNLVQTQFNTGLTEKETKQAIEILNKK